MVGRPPGDRSIDPGELLRSALEKIVYFECRVAQLESELAAARQVAERARADAALARSREAEAATALAAGREAHAAASLRDADLSERVRLLEAERERLMAGLVERARVGGAPDDAGQPGPDADAADLAGFIAELRGELEELRAWKQAHLAGEAAPAAPPKERAAPPASLDAMAGAFAAGGRTGLLAGDVRKLEALLPTNADRVLYERAMGDLTSAAPEARLTAVRRLSALGTRAAAPLLAAALGREPDAGVKVALLRALAGFGEPFAAGLATRELSDARAEVRAAALEALAAVAEGDALPHLLRALDDRGPVVRRRAAVLLNGAKDPRAEEGLVAALRDADQGVARAAAVALSGRTSDRARRALARHGLAQGGAETPSPAALRIAARLAELGVSAPAPAPVASMTTTTATATATATATTAIATPAAAPAAALTAAAQPARRTAVAVLEAPAPRPAPRGAPGDELLEAVEQELRGALRGRTAAELEAATGAGPARIEAALEILRARGAVVPRGPRWCIA